MMRSVQTFWAAGGLVLAALSLAGCAETVIGAGVTAGVAIAQERSIGQAVDDKVIQANINHQLLQRDEALFRRVETEVVEGRVLLTGGVPKPEHRVEAARLTWKVVGVKEVLNELQVTDKSGISNYAKDSWVTTQLRAKMLGDIDIFDINYTVETVNGIVYLMGIARSQGELERVTGYARNIRGVSKVVSHVVLKTDPSRKS